MGQQWMEPQPWVFPQRFFHENLELGQGGEEERDNDIVRETFERTGASGSGVRLFEGVDASRVALEPVRAESSPRATHLTYTVGER